MNQKNKEYLLARRWIVLALILPLLVFPLLLVWLLQLWLQFIGVVLGIIFVEGFRFCWGILASLYEDEGQEEQEQN